MKRVQRLIQAVTSTDVTYRAALEQRRQERDTFMRTGTDESRQAFQFALQAESETWRQAVATRVALGLIEFMPEQRGRDDA